MIKLTVWILFLGVLAYSSLSLFLYLRQRSLIFYPHAPAHSGEAEVVWLDNDGERLKVWQVDRQSQTALIYFGGNAEDVSLNLSRFKTLFPDLSLYMMNYRGYGGSSGQPSETALYSDSRALYEHIAASYERIVVMGRSLGTAVAIQLAAAVPVDGLVLVTPYSSMTRLAHHYYPFLPVRPLLKDRFEAVQYAADIDVPVLALIAERDEVIPAKISAELVDSLDPLTVRRVIIKGTFHNTIDHADEYESQLVQFINSFEQESR